MEVHLNSLDFVMQWCYPSVIIHFRGFFLSLVALYAISTPSTFTCYRNEGLLHLQPFPPPPDPTHTAGFSFTSKSASLLHIIYRFQDTSSKSLILLPTELGKATVGDRHPINTTGTYRPTIDRLNFGQG